MFFKDLFVYLCECSVFLHTRRGNQISLKMVVRCLLGIELRTCGNAASALNHWGISPAALESYLSINMSELLMCGISGFNLGSILSDSSQTPAPHTLQFHVYFVFSVGNCGFKVIVSRSQDRGQKGASWWTGSECVKGLLLHNFECSKANELDTSLGSVL